MNKKQFFIVIFLLCFSCKKESTTNIKFLMEELMDVKAEIHSFYFNKDTLIITKKGNKIYLIKEDYLKPYNDSLNISIEEYFDKKDLIMNNIRTITNKGELLESKGVLKVDLSCGSKPYILKKGKSIKVDLINQDYSDNHIYIASLDSINQFNWIKTGSLKVPFTLFSKRYNEEKLISLDSLAFYRRKNDSLRLTLKNQELLFGNQNNQKLISVLINNNNWINIDKLIETPLKKDFRIRFNQEDSLKDYMIYIIYENLNSFVSHYLTINNLTVEQIPIIGNAKGIIVTYVDEKILYDEFNINASTSTDIRVNLKNIELDNLKKLLTSY